MKKTRILEIIWWAIALGLVFGCWINAVRGLSGWDWFVFFYPHAQEMDPSWLWYPLWIYLILTPISYLPAQFSYVIFLVINVCMIWLGSRLTGSNRFAVLISFPAFWILWYGQLDGFVLLGVALGLWALQHKKPVAVGVSILLLLAKPHIGGPLALIYFLRSMKRDTIMVIGLAFLITMVLWGWDWPLIWIRNLVTLPQADLVIHRTNISLYPWGLLAWLVLLIPMSQTEQAITAISATLLSIPYAPTYSILSLLVLPIPWWAYLISSAPFILGQNGYWITVFAPLGCIGWIIVSHARSYIRSS
ncbi:MAG: hypothetical protein A2W33_06795 [Chloroflexi bacterium RBG_16_52_11]|nr:MAG: hypothetical protein A2W33_06795 [Chloroflexi bacterium RBG_16_52_11]